MNDFTIDSATRLRKQLWEQEKIKRDVERDDNEKFGNVIKFVPIPYTPPRTLWKASETSKRAFAIHCIKSIMP